MNPAKVRTVAAWTAIFILGMGLRFLSIPGETPGGLPRFRGGTDSIYHFRRATLAAAGRDLRTDAWTNFPIGDRVGWPEGYDRALGWVYSRTGTKGLRILPIGIGLAGLALLALWSRRLGAAGSTYAGLLFAALPPVVILTSYAALDHHGFEILLFVASLLGAARGDARGLLLSVGTCAVAVGTVPAWPVPFLATCAAWGIRRGTPAFAATVAALAAVSLPLSGLDVIADSHLQAVTEMFPLHRYMATQGGMFFPIFQLSAGIFALPWAIRRWWPRRREPAVAAALAATFVALPLSLVAMRFLIYLAAPTALAAGEAFAALAVRWNRPFAARILAGLVAAAPIYESVRAQRLPPPVHNLVLEKAYMRLREITPSAGDPLDPLRRPAYGVLAPWNLGFHIVVLGERPAVSAPIWWNGTPRAPVGEIFFSTPERGNVEADSNRVRVLLLAPNMWQRGYPERYWPAQGPPLTESLAFRLYLLGDTSIGWRRIHASEERWILPERAVPAVQIWERDR